MKKIILLIIILLIAIGALLVRTLFFIDTKTNDNIDNKEKTPEVITGTRTEEKTPEVKEEKTVYPDDVYKVLDFDRRLIIQIGQQDKELCSIFNLAYARSILDNKKADPYDYYDGDGAVWRWADFADIASSDPLLTVLQRAYDEIEAGRPLIAYVAGTYGYTTGEVPVERSSYMHYVLLIGHRMNADYDNLKASDFYAADPSNGYCCGDDSYMPWIILSDDALEKTSGEYAVYAEYESTKQLKTCIAYPDRYKWDADLSKPLLPAYYEENKEQ